MELSHQENELPQDVYNPVQKPDHKVIEIHSHEYVNFEHDVTFLYYREG